MVLRVSRGGHENLEITTTARGRRDDALVEGGWIYSVRNNQQAATINNKHQTIDKKQLIANKPTTNIKKNTTNNNRAICITFLLNAPWM